MHGDSCRWALLATCNLCDCATMSTPAVPANIAVANNNRVTDSNSSMEAAIRNRNRCTCNRVDLVEELPPLEERVV